jgi:hypothetical protein
MQINLNPCVKKRDFSFSSYSQNSKIGSQLDPTTHQVNTRTNTQSITILYKNHYAISPTYKSNIIQKPDKWKDMNSKKQSSNNHQHKLSFIKVIIKLAFSCNYRQVCNLKLGYEKGHPSFHIKK